MSGEIKVLNGFLEDDKAVTGQVVLRGVLDQNSLKFIQMDWYQREQGFSTAHTQKIVGAYFSADSIEDITLGMRGHRCRSKDNKWTLHDPCYCINGGQRLFAASLAMRDRPDLKIHLGCKVYFGTTEKFENDLFCKLGTSSVPVNSNVLIRNKKKESKAALLLVNMNNNPKFALQNRVAWDQRKTRHELISGRGLAHIVGLLHAHKGSALKSNKAYELLGGLDQLVQKIGAENFQTNIVRFFDVIDSCWTIRNLSGDNIARPHMKHLFLCTIARLFSAYPDFWDGKERNEFWFPKQFYRKLKAFKLADYIVPGRVPKEALYELLRKQLALNPIYEETEADDEIEAAE